MTDEVPSPETPREELFPPTRWSLVLQYQDTADAGSSSEALAALCEAYWYPLYAYVRRKGHAAPEAQDLTQAFFAKLLSKEHLKNVDQNQGRLRAYLQTALKRFLVSDWKKQNQLKRGGACVIQSLDAGEGEARYLAEPVDERTPDHVLSDRWLATLLERAGQALEKEYSEAGKQDLFLELRDHLRGEAEQGDTYRAVADRMGLSEGGVKVTVHRMRKRFQALFRQEVAETVSSPDEVEDEIRCLLAGAH